MKLLITFTSHCVARQFPELQGADWTIDSTDDWTKNIKSAEGAAVADGSVSPKAKTATIDSTKVHASDVKRSAKSLVVTQSAIWQNWNPIENLGPVNSGRRSGSAYRGTGQLLDVRSLRQWAVLGERRGRIRIKSLYRLSNRKRQRWKDSTSLCKPRDFRISSTRRGA